MHGKSLSRKQMALFWNSASAMQFFQDVVCDCDDRLAEGRGRPRFATALNYGDPLDRKAEISEETTVRQSRQHDMAHSLLREITVAVDAPLICVFSSGELSSGLKSELPVLDKPTIEHRGMTHRKQPHIVCPYPLAPSS